MGDGNRRFDAANATDMPFSGEPTSWTLYNQTKNQIVKSSESVSTNDVTYDSSGNMTANPAIGSGMTYDAENRLVSATSPAVSYVYDGDGKRVIATAGG